MRLEITQHPQDESADAAVHMALSPSYVTYNPVTVQRVMDFFKTEEVLFLCCTFDDGLLSPGSSDFVRSCPATNAIKYRCVLRRG